MNFGEAAILIGLIIINGVFAGSELALVSARKGRLLSMRRKLAIFIGVAPSLRG